jgi:hypothetical protein
MMRLTARHPNLPVIQPAIARKKMKFSGLATIQKSLEAMKNKAAPDM